MKKSLFTLVLAFLIIIGNTTHSFAALPARTRSLQITMRGYIVQNRTDALLIGLKKPQNMAIDKRDNIFDVQLLPMTADTVIVDANGKQIQQGVILPGQEVAATFQYSVTPSAFQADRNDYFESQYRVTGCSKISLVGEPIKLKTATTIGELKPNYMLGTILAVKGNRIEVFIEGGRIISEDTGTEFMAIGEMEDEIKDDTVLLDSLGNPINASSIKPFTRVLIKGKNHNFYDDSYGYSNSEFSRIQVLDFGEKTLAPGDTESFRRLTATVLRQQKSADGKQQLVIQPDDGRHERKHQSEYIITQSDATNAPQLWAFKDGTHIELSYIGLNYATKPGRIIEYNNLKAITSAR